MYNKAVSMSKGIAIILMVLAHTEFLDYGDAFIGMFHMPLFFVMSGYCFKESYLNSFKGFAIKRIKGAYVPFVKWGIIFLLLHNVFFNLNIYNGEYGYRDTVSSIYTIQDFLKNGALTVACIKTSEQLLGGYWFLKTYFVASFLAFATIWLFRKNAKITLRGGHFCCL